MEPSVIEKQQKMFAMVLNDKNNRSFKAEINGELAGIMVFTSSAYCQMRPAKMLGLLPKLISMFGTHLIPVLKWRMNWGKHDHKAPHIHFGPLAVEKSQQGMGVGKALLTHFCNYLDMTKQIGYLETDKVENVALYQKFGFEVLEEDSLFGVKNWFMVRKSV